ncbi:MAG: hypothetical protein WAU33_03785 [Candidatus Binataceae bacterium]
MMPARKCSIAAMLAMTWLMIMPPPKMPLVKDKSGSYEVDLTTPINKWILFASYRNQAACRGDLKSKPHYFICIDRTNPAFRAAAIAEAQKEPRAKTAAPAAQAPQAPPKN